VTATDAVGARTDATASAATDPLDGLHIIDCDGHFTEPPDLWSSRAPASLHDRLPAQRTVDGRTAWYLDGEVWASLGGNTIATNREKILGSYVVQPFDRVDPAAWSVKERLALLDSIGIHAQIVYPNAIGFSSNHIFAIRDEGERTTVLRIYNDFLADIQEESGGRLLPQAVLPIWDIELTVGEMTRLIDRGIAGFTLSDRPELLGLPELPEPYFDPMWDLFATSGTVANFHIGSGARREEMESARASATIGGETQPVVTAAVPAVAAPAWRSFGPQRRMAVMSAQLYMSNARIIVNLCMSDLFDRYPGLRIASPESGIGWVPFILEALEYQFDEMVTTPGEVALTKRRPKEYFRDHIYVMFWFESVAPQKLIDDVGVNNVLVETDIPHSTCLYPGTREHFAEVTRHLDAHTRRRIFQDNAAELYGIQLPKD
jgi:predicted TIM-barrel fold metal-dependent hydrolase